MADKSKKSFFETGLMRSRIKSPTVSLFPEAGLGYLLGPILALVGNGVINIWLVQYWQRVLGFLSLSLLLGLCRSCSQNILHALPILLALVKGTNKVLRICNGVRVSHKIITTKKSKQSFPPFARFL